MSATVRDDAVLAGVENGVLTIRLNRPDRLNAVTTDVLDRVSELVESAAASDTRAIVIRGEGRAFCSGADLDPAVAPDNPISTVDAANRLIRALRSTPCPVVTCVHGAVAGVGVSIALAGDVVLATFDTYFTLAFTRVGLMPDGGASILVAAAAGRVVALRMALLADRVPAPEALSHGMITAVVDDLDASLADLLATLAHGPRRSFALTKAAIEDATLERLDRTLENERAGQHELLSAHDFAEGSAAFTERRRPDFTDPYIT